ncbi:hypothetical protein MC885_000131 [Smutsia gigantea]|nr:hypothetical protein MC885_000131 [Smutsia gigantea]
MSGEWDAVSMVPTSSYTFKPLIMETSGESSNSSERVVPPAPAQQRDLEPRVARRRLSQARHRATLAGLFGYLRKTVYSQSDFTPSKWQVLNKVKSHIQELEQNLDNLLKLKEYFNLEDGNANTLEEVKKEYVSMYSRNHRCIRCCALKGWHSPQSHIFTLQSCFQSLGSRLDFGGNCRALATALSPEKDTEEEEEDQDEDQEEEKEEEKKVELLHSPAASRPDLMEFERYLSFYKQTMDLLTGNGIVSSQEVTLPIVSAAISHLWQNLPEARKASLLQILLEDAFDVASFLDKSEAPSTSSSSSAFAGCNPENPEGNFQLYTQIINYFQGLSSVNAQLKQEPDLSIDNETIMLRCMETFDDDDL